MFVLIAAALTIGISQWVSAVSNDSSGAQSDVNPDQSGDFELPYYYSGLPNSDFSNEHSDQYRYFGDENRAIYSFSSRKLGGQRGLISVKGMGESSAQWSLRLPVYCARGPCARKPERVAGQTARGSVLFVVVRPADSGDEVAAINAQSGKILWQAGCPKPDESLDGIGFDDWPFMSCYDGSIFGTSHRLRLAPPA